MRCTARCTRPWGWYDGIDQGPRHQVKRICVKQGASLSLQMHHHRAEHWIVVSGTAEVTNGDKVIMLTENQSTYIPLGQTHRLPTRARCRWKSSKYKAAATSAKTTSCASKTPTGGNERPPERLQSRFAGLRPAVPFTRV